MSQKDYYNILGVEKSATKDEIKKAFRSLASKYHPDKKTGDEAKFKEVSEAYAVLGDEKKRAEYDTYGHAFSGQGGGRGGGFNWSDFNQAGGQHFEFDIGDIFENFGEMFGGFGGGRRKENRGRDISIDIELEFKDAVFGVERAVLLSKNTTCTHCNGTGAKDPSSMTTCTTCNGNGKIRETRQSIMGNFMTVRECPQCSGAGKIPKEKCGHCAGNGIRKLEEEIHIKIPPGIQNGEVIRMPQKGEAIPRGTAGDLYVKIHVKAHPSITRDGSNLYSTLPVRLSDALLGATYKVSLLDGEVDIKIPPGISYGEKLRIKGKGVPINGKRGDHLVKIVIETPKKLSRNARKLIEELRNEGI